MYADVARIKVRKASNCSLGDRLCAFAKIPMFVGADTTNNHHSTPRLGGRQSRQCRSARHRHGPDLPARFREQVRTDQRVEFGAHVGRRTRRGYSRRRSRVREGRRGAISRRVWTAGRRRVITRARGSSCILQRCILHGSEHVIRTCARGRERRMRGRREPGVRGGVGTRPPGANERTGARQHRR